MKKNIIAMAVAAAVAAPVAAMADTTLYGKIHASYNFWSGDNAEDNDYSLASNSSRLGIKGKEAISDNLSLIYQWEATVGWGAAGGDNAGFGGQRNTFIGFTGDWGTAIAGRHDTPMKQVSRKYDLFGDTIGDSRNIVDGRQRNAGAFPVSETIDINVDGTQVTATGTIDNDNGWDLRTNNTVAYVTPNMGGFQAKVAYVSNWAGELDNEFDAYSVSAGYEIGGFSIDAAYEQHNAGFDTAGVSELSDDQNAYRIGLGYKIGGFKVVGLYQQIENAGIAEATASIDGDTNTAKGFIDGNDVSMYGVGAAYTFGKSTVKAQYYAADDMDIVEDSDADMWAIGYDYKVSKQTSVYAAYASMDQGANGAYALGYGGHGERPAFSDNGDAFGADSSAFSVGLVHKF